MNDLMIFLAGLMIGWWWGVTLALYMLILRIAGDDTE